MMTKALKIAVMFALLLALPAQAQFLPQDGDAKPQLASAETVAKIWYRLAGKTPDFDAWAMRTPEYLSADTFSRERALGEARARLSQGFSLLVPGEVLAADMPVELSAYSAANAGFLIESLTPMTFLKFSYLGENYAVVPEQIYEMQWLPAEPEAAMKLDALRRAAPDGKTVTLTLQLSPRFAAPSDVTVEGTGYHVLSAGVVSMSFHGPDGALAWRRERRASGPAAPAEDARRQELLNLRQ